MYDELVLVGKWCDFGTVLDMCAACFSWIVDRVALVKVSIASDRFALWCLYCGADASHAV
jgi:hypothetical protein